MRIENKDWGLRLEIGTGIWIRDSRFGLRIKIGDRDQGLGLRIKIGNWDFY